MHAKARETHEGMHISARGGGGVNKLGISTLLGEPRKSNYFDEIQKFFLVINIFNGEAWKKAKKPSA